jgi:hypothetical protein
VGFHGVAPQVIRLSSQEMAGKVYSQCCCKVICISSDEFKYFVSSYFDGHMEILKGILRSADCHVCV